MTMHYRAATFGPQTYNKDSGTIDAVISTFQPVQRAGFLERLDPAGLDTTQLIGAPVLDGHKQASARDAIGVITAHRIEGNSLIATIQLSGASDAQTIVQRISEGTIRGVSIGYRVTRWADSVDPQTKSKVRTAVGWTINEVSAVPIPADSGATFRSLPMEVETLETPIVEVANPQINTRAEIRTIARAANMTVEQADDMVDRNLSVTEARAEAFEAMQQRSRNTPRIRVTSSNDDHATQMSRRADALYARVSGEAPKPEAQQFMVESLRDMARASVEATGQSTRGMDADQLFRAAMHTSSDFPQLLNNTGNRTLLAAYQAAQSPIKSVLARSTTHSDFRKSSKLKLSDIGLLEQVSESGEIKSTSRGETSESYALDTYATKFALSRKALINDDLGAFRDWGNTAGRMAAETEANLLVNLLLSNPVMGEDSKALFHADHENIGAAGEITVALLDQARRAMRNMKALDGKTPINATPKYLLVGPELETTAEQVLAAIYAASVNEVNPFTGKLTLLVEPRITDQSWYVFADPAVLPTLEYAYLSSAQGPQMASREGFDVLGMEFRVVLDFGCGATDWRGAYFTPDS